MWEELAWSGVGVDEERGVGECWGKMGRLGHTHNVAHVPIFESCSS